MLENLEPDNTELPSIPLALLLDNISLPVAPDSARIFHGRGHCFDGLSHINIDLLRPVVLITSYKAISHNDQLKLVDALQLLCGDAITGIALQQRELPQAPVTWLWGEPVSHLVIEEAGLKYGVTLGQRQNCGFFFDMVNGRRWMQASANGKKVLNLFSYTCAFSVAAIAGGAKAVVNLDMSSASLSQGRHNHKLNHQCVSQVSFLAHDLFKSWGKLRRLGPYDLIVIDPPSMQKGSFNARRDYGKVVRRLPQLLVPGGEALLCLNAPELDIAFLTQVVNEQAPELERVTQLPLPDNIQESDPDKGLKTLVYKRSAISRC